jgi:amino acid transporter
MYDVRPEQYATVIRDLIKHENDVTNHRIMWLLIVQGLLVNAYVVLRRDANAAYGLALAGVFVTLSAFVMLYKSYQARGYLNFLRAEAKQGKLQEEYLRLDGWPRKRIKHWRRGVWMCPWLERASDVLEPYLSLPALIVISWMFLILPRWTPRSSVIVLAVAVVLGLLVLFVFCIVWVWVQGTDEVERTGDSVR